VDQHLPAQHRQSRSADHLIQLSHNGPALDRTNLRLAHRSCNSTRSNRLRNVPKDRCACINGLPCARINTKQTFSVDLASV
jgi:hypothetical protein